MLPVSYTHLDVYKRQVLEGRGDMMTAGSPYAVLGDLLRRRCKLSHSSEAPVSYTHLDVYKRQPLLSASGVAV